MQDMDANELVNWMAYEMTCDDDFRKKAEKALALEKSAKMTAEQRAEQMKNMFKRLGRKNGTG